MQLIDKLNELNATAQRLESALQAAQSLQDERIKSEVAKTKSELKSEVKSELETSITNTLQTRFEDIVKTNTSKEVLNGIFVENVLNNASVMNRVLDLAEFDERVQNAIDERCEIYMNSYKRYQNSYAALAAFLEEKGLSEDSVKNIFSESLLKVVKQCTM